VPTLYKLYWPAVKPSGVYPKVFSYKYFNTCKYAASGKYPELDKWHLYTLLFWEAVMFCVAFEYPPLNQTYLNKPSLWTLFPYCAVFFAFAHSSLGNTVFIPKFYWFASGANTSNDSAKFFNNPWKLETISYKLQGLFRYLSEKSLKSVVLPSPKIFGFEDATQLTYLGRNTLHESRATGDESRLLLLDFGPFVFECHGAVKNELAIGTIGVNTEIAKPLELITL